MFQNTLNDEQAFPWKSNFYMCPKVSAIFLLSPGSEVHIGSNSSLLLVLQTNLSLLNVGLIWKPKIKIELVFNEFQKKRCVSEREREWRIWWYSKYMRQFGKYFPMTDFADGPASSEK